MDATKRAVFLLLLLFQLFLLPATPPALAAFEGEWSGNTDDDGRVFFQIADNNIITFRIGDICVYGGTGSSGECFEAYLSPISAPISGNSFNFSGIYLDITGTFTASNVCGGTWNYHDPFLGYGSGTWTAYFPAPPLIVLSSPPQDFSEQLINTSSDTLTYTLSNSDGGIATGSVFLTGPDDDQFELVSGGGNFALAHGERKDILVRFTPSSEGFKTATLSAQGDIPANDTDATLTGTGIYPILSVDPDVAIVSIDEGQTTFSVANAGTGTMPWSVQKDPSDSWFSIEIGESGANSGSIVVSYQANYWDARVGTIAVAAPNAANSPIEVEIRQEGGRLPELILTPGDYNFGNRLIGTSTDTFVFTMRNQGGGNASGVVSLGGTNADQFQIINGEGFFSLAHEEQKQIYVRFFPTTTGEKSAILMADGVSPSNDASAALEGIGVYPVLLLAPTQQNVPASIGITSFTVTNDGSGNMPWVAEVDQSSPWITIKDGSSGINNGSVTIEYEANDGDERTGFILVTADGAGNSPQAFQLFQAAYRPEWKLTASDGASTDRFGNSVSLSGNLAIVGANNNDDQGTDSGSAYVFEQINDEWIQQAKLTADDGARTDRFGSSVSISGDFAIVGAFLDDDNGTDSGSVYVFERINDEWIQHAKLTADDGASGDNFGRSVGISGNFAIVGADGDDDNGASSGSAYVFERLSGAWMQRSKLTASDGENGDRFGYSVSIYGNFCIVGAVWDDDNGVNSGSAYVFEKPYGGWVDMTETAKLTAIDGEYSDSFGGSVSISGNFAIVGADGDDDNGASSGSAYIFERIADEWMQKSKLLASDGASTDRFGGAVSIYGDIAIVGAVNNYANGTRAGAAYIFERPVSGWVDMTETGKVSARDGVSGDIFGSSVSMSGDHVIVGAPGDDDHGEGSGSGYIYFLPLATPSWHCKGDFDHDGDVDGVDLSFFSQAFQTKDRLYEGDLDENGIIDADDLEIFAGELGIDVCAIGFFEDFNDGIADNWYSPDSR